MRPGKPFSTAAAEAVTYCNWHLFQKVAVMRLTSSLFQTQTLKPGATLTLDVLDHIQTANQRSCCESTASSHKHQTARLWPSHGTKRSCITAHVRPIESKWSMHIAVLLMYGSLVVPQLKPFQAQIRSQGEPYHMSGPMSVT